MDPQTTKFRNIAIALLVLSALAFITNPTGWLWMNPPTSPTLHLLSTIVDFALRTAIFVGFGFGVAMLGAYFVRRPARSVVADTAE